MPHSSARICLTAAQARETAPERLRRPAWVLIAQTCNPILLAPRARRHFIQLSDHGAASQKLREMRRGPLGVLPRSV